MTNIEQRSSKKRELIEVSSRASRIEVMENEEWLLISDDFRAIWNGNGETKPLGFQLSAKGFNLLSLRIRSLSVCSREPCDTISSKHKQTFPYFSKNNRSLGAFLQTSFTEELTAFKTSINASSSYTSFPTAKMHMSPITVYTMNTDLCDATNTSSSRDVFRFSVVSFTKKERQCNRSSAGSPWNRSRSTLPVRFVNNTHRIMMNAWSELSDPIRVSTLRNRLPPSPPKSFWTRKQHLLPLGDDETFHPYGWIMWKSHREGILDGCASSIHERVQNNTPNTRTRMANSALKCRIIILTS